jgi:hypothetical protein
MGWRRGGCRLMGRFLILEVVLLLLLACIFTGRVGRGYALWRLGGKVSGIVLWVSCTRFWCLLGGRFLCALGKGFTSYVSCSG